MLFSGPANAARRALTLSDDSFGTQSSPEVIAALQARGYHVDSSKDMDEDGAILAIEQFQLSVQPGDQVVIFISCHGRISADTSVLETKQHTCCLDRECNHELSEDVVRTELIGPLVKRGIHPVLMEDACGSGSTVLNFQDVPQACVISTTGATGPTYSGTTHIGTSLSQTSIHDFGTLARELERNRVHEAQNQPLRASNDVWYSGCADPAGMELRDALFEDAAYLGEYNLARTSIYHQVLPQSTRAAGQESLSTFLQTGCTKDAALGTSFERWQTDMTTALDESTGEALFQTHSDHGRQSLLAGGLLPGNESIQSWRDLRSSIQAQVRRMRETRNRMERALRELNTQVDALAGASGPARQRAEEQIQALRQGYSRLNTQSQEELRQFDTLFTWVREIQCSAQPSPCSDVSI
jgi:hypothetical protein